MEQVDYTIIVTPHVLIDSDGRRTRSVVDVDRRLICVSALVTDDPQAVAAAAAQAGYRLGAALARQAAEQGGF